MLDGVKYSYMDEMLVILSKFESKLSSLIEEFDQGPKTFPPKKATFNLFFNKLENWKRGVNEQTERFLDDAKKDIMKTVK